MSYRCETLTRTRVGHHHSWDLTCLPCIALLQAPDTPQLNLVKHLLLCNDNDYLS